MPITSAPSPAYALKSGGQRRTFPSCRRWCEGEREKQQHGVLLAEVVAELHIHEAGGLFGLERKVGGFGSDGNWHNLISFDF